jgi:hypothetical protein
MIPYEKVLGSQPFGSQIPSIIQSSRLQKMAQDGDFTMQPWIDTHMPTATIFKSHVSCS